MTEFITGSAGTGKGACILDRIRRRLGDGRKKYLIVPEQQAVLWEARVCRALPPSSALELEVVSFKRLADTVFRSVGGLWRNYTGDVKKTLLMWSAVCSVNDDLTVFRCADGHEEKYVPVLIETLNEISSRGVDPAALSRAADEAEEGSRLAAKLSDLSLIYSAYRALEEKSECEDPERILDMLAATLRDHRFFRGCEVFIDSFYSLTPVETEILYYIMRDAEDLVITFTMDDSSRGAHFDHVKKFRRTALTLAERTSREVTKTALTGNLRCRAGDILYLEKNLWDFSAVPCDGRDGSVRVIRCRDRYEEARAVGAAIERAVHGGASYSDVAVVAKDIEAYRGILDAKLERLGIPFYISKRASVASSPVLTLATSLLDAVSDGCRPESVTRCVKTGLFAPDAKQCAYFEDYISKWNVRGIGAYTRAEDWRMNPDGYKKTVSERGAAALEAANEVRRAVGAPLGRLYSLFSGGQAEVSDVCSTLYEILRDMDVSRRLGGIVDEIDRLGRHEEARETASSLTSVVDALGAMARTVPTAKITPSAASRLIFTVASSLDVGSIPLNVDSVTLGSAAGLRCGEVRHVILVGCSEGEFPSAPKESGVFSFADKEALEGLGIILSDGRDAEQSEELFRFWRCVSMPSETLTVTFPASGDEGGVSPSVGARQIMKLLSVEATDWSDISRYEEVWSHRSAAEAAITFTGDERRAARELSCGGEAPRRLLSPLSADFESISEKTASEISPRTLSLTQSRIDKFSECPFSYYARYVLKLDEPESVSVGAVDVGNLVHRVLEVFFKETSGRDFPIPDDETQRLVDRITGEHLAEIMNGEPSARQRYLFRRLKRNVTVLVKEIMEEFSKTEFRPYRFELPMGNDDASPVPLKFKTDDGRNVSLFGTIDRVDRFDDGENVYVRVVDYKTFGKSFNISDIQKGVNLQLLIYLFTLWKGDDCKFRRDLAPHGEAVLPAGMIYLSAAPDGASSDTPVTPEEASALAAASITRSGVILDDPVSVAAMGEGGEFLGGRRTSRLSLDEFGALYDEVEKVIVGIASDILGGKCASTPMKNPSHDPCKYCRMKPFCRHIDERRDEDA